MQFRPCFSKHRIGKGSCQSGAWKLSSLPKFNWRFSSGVDYIEAKCAANEQVISGTCGTDLSRPLDTAGINLTNNAYGCGDWGNTALIYAGALCMYK